MYKADVEYSLNLQPSVVETAVEAAAIPNGSKVNVWLLRETFTLQLLLHSRERERGTENKCEHVRPLEPSAQCQPGQVLAQDKMLEYVSKSAILKPKYCGQLGCNK